MKLFVTDYDGTLFTDDRHIKDSIRLLKKLRNNNFLIVISTGRSYPSIKNQVDTYNIPYDYLSCADGSIIYDNKDNIAVFYSMNTDIIKPFQDFYQNLNFEEIQHSYPEGYSNVLKENNNKLLGINVCMSTVNYTKEIVDSFLKMGKSYPNYSFLNYMHPNFSYLCIKPKGVSKSSAIEYLKNKYTIDKENIFVIGDADNDFEMIRDYNGYAMNSSCKKVLDIAKKSYESIDNFIIDILKGV